MRRILAAVVATACLSMVAAPVMAGGRHGHGYHGGYGHGYHGRHRGHHHSGKGYYLLGGLVGGLILGHVLTRSYYDPPRRYAAPRTYYGGAPRTYYGGAPVAVRPSIPPGCKPTTGTAPVGGRLAIYGGTYCYDAYGNGYVVAGSEYFIGYAQ